MMKSIVITFISIAVNVLIGVNLHAQDTLGFSPLHWSIPLQSDNHFCSEEINFHPNWCLENTTIPFAIPLDDKVENLSLFLVYENHLSDQLSELNQELTTNRINDIFTGNEVESNMYFTPKFINLQSYEDQNKFVIQDREIRFSDFENGQPGFMGKIAEVIVFDSYIPTETRKNIESYLSIKYGISLHSDSTYHSSDHTPIWIPTNEFKHRLTGIGRDDFFNLNQIKSRNTEISSVLTLEAQNAFDENSSYVFWADNNLEAEFLDINAEVSLLNRSWMFSNYNRFGVDKKYSHKFDLEYIEGFDSTKHAFLVVFNNPIIESNLFDGNWFSVNQSDNDLFVTNVPLYGSQNTYSRLIQTEESLLLNRSITIACGEADVSIPILALANKESSIIILNNENNLVQNIQLGQKQKINAFLEEGEYLVSLLNKNGDRTIEKLLTIEKEKDCDENGKRSSRLLYPNPTLSRSEFTLESKLILSGCTLQILDINGQLVKSKDISPGNSSYSDVLDKPGMYTILVSNQSTSETYSLVVQ